MVDNIPQTALRTERHADVDSRRIDVNANKLIHVSMTQLLQLHMTEYMLHMLRDLLAAIGILQFS